MNSIVTTNLNTGAHDENILDIDAVAYGYINWMQEDPFEYDTACNLSLRSAKTAADAINKA